MSKLLCDMLLWPKRMVIPVIKDEEGNILEDPGDLEKRPVSNRGKKRESASADVKSFMSVTLVFVRVRSGARSAPCSSS